jgi:cytochrome c peroxidase
MRAPSLPTFFALSLLAGEVQAQLPSPSVPPENPITEEKRILGKIIYWEEQLSSSNNIACGTCHRPEAGGADPREGRHPGFNGIYGDPDDVLGSEGVRYSGLANDFLPETTFGREAQVTPRTSPSVFTASYHDELFWDGRASSTFTVPDTGEVAILVGGALESQSLGPILSAVEMGHEGRTWVEVTQKLEALRPMALATSLPPDMAAALVNGETYPDLFAAAFGDPTISAKRIAFAIATYERTLVPDQTPWDLYEQGQTSALTTGQINGLSLFLGDARCSLCHVPPLFSDDEFHNLGNRPYFEDIGRRGVTGFFSDRGRFKTPSLRNVGLRSRYFHNGQNGGPLIGPTFGGGPLGQVFLFYFFGGGNFDENLDSDLDPLNGPGGLTQDDLIDVRAFIEDGLTDPRVAGMQSPFDRPTLYSERLDDGIEVIGSGVAGSGGLIPEVLLEVAPAVGNNEFRVGIHDALGGAAAFLRLAVVSAPSAPPFNPTGRWTYPGITLEGAGGGAGAGYGTWHGPLRRSPGMIGRRFDLQWLVLDPSAPGAVARSRTVRVTLF